MELEYTSLSERIDHLKNPENLILPELFGRRIGYSKPKYPGFYHIHNIDDFSVNHFDEAVCNEFSSSLDEIKALGGQFAKLVIHPEDYDRVMNALRALANSLDKDKVINYFYRLKLRTEDQEGYILVITSVKLDIKKHKFICITNTTDQLPVFSKKICSALNDNFNTKNVIQLYLKLTSREKEISLYLFKGIKAKEIATQLFVSEKTIEQHKKNIFKKMRVHSIQELIHLGSYLHI